MDARRSLSAALGSTRGSVSGASFAHASPHPPAIPLVQQQQDAWTHHDIDYSFRFPYPNHQPPEYFSPATYTDEDTLRRLGSRGAASSPPTIEPWRSRDRMRTQCVALVACLNIGVDPPDAIKPTPCARMQCWTDPESMVAPKALKAIGTKLQLQYELWHQRAKYKTLLDPTAEDLRKTLITLRRTANEERVLLHYNGHGVPKPTASEIWVYNKGYPPTQYIPVSLYDLQTWMGGISAPSIYVFDCSYAGTIVTAFQHFLDQRRTKMAQKLAQANAQHPSTRNNVNSAFLPAGAEDADGHVDDAAVLASLHDPCRHILLAACSATEALPTNPDLPADLFTACLTTPIKMALRWFVSRSPLNAHGNVSDPAHGGLSAAANRQRMYELIEKLPGMNKPSNRKSPFGELNWIFTAITDSIAWNILPRDVFQKLFRQDVLVSSLFRNFLLAQRILASYQCTAVSSPPIAATHLHPLWSCWDLASDIALSQLERFEKHGTPFTPSTFFEEQLTSFEIWLDSPMNQTTGHANNSAGGSGGTKNGKSASDASKESYGGEKRPPPMQLPIVLQVLLSTDHRLRALQLLARFMDKGSWAVNLSLSVGIFPYVLKLLQSPSRELREVLVFIWAKILALDRSVAGDLSKIDYCSYFVQHLLKYQAPTGGAMAAALSGGAHKHSGLHSRSSSVAASPIIRPGQLSLSSTPASTPFHTGFSTAFGSTGSGPPSAVATPHLGVDGAPQAQQYPFKPLQLHTSPTLRSTLPPLDLPPADLSDGASSTHSMQLRDPLPVAHAHLGVNAQAFAQMRAQPLHDPSVRLPEDYVPPVDPMLLLAANPVEAPSDDAISGLPPVHPQLQQSPSMQPRVPFPLDLTAPQSSLSPIQSPSQPVGASSLNTSKSSPMLSGLASLSPTSPLLSPIMRSTDGTFERQSRFETSPHHHETSAPKDSLQDAHDLTRVARELLLTTDLQHLLSLFIISCIAHSNPKGQQTLMQSGLSSFRELISPTLLFASDVRLRKWTCFAVGQCWRGFGHAKTVGASEGVPEALVQKLMDPQPSVRAAALWALGTFFGGKIMMNQQTAGQAMSPSQSARAHALKSQQRLELELNLGVAMSTLINDGSPAVRRELMLSLAELVYFQQDLFLAIATAHPRNRESISTPGWHIWRAILRGCRDCSHQVQEVALAIKGYLKARAILNQSQLGRMIGSQHNPGLHLLHRDLANGGGAQNHAATYPIEEDEMGAEGMEGASKTEATGENGTGSRRGSAESRNTIASSTDRRPSVSSSRSRTNSESASVALSSRTHTQSIAHIDADELGADDPTSTLVAASDRESRPALSSHAHSNVSAPPIRHFTRFKMGHLRPAPPTSNYAMQHSSGSGLPSQGLNPGGAGSSVSGLGPGAGRRSEQKAGVIRNLEGGLAGVSGNGPQDGGSSESGASAPTLDERATDAMWTVPKSRIFEDAYAEFRLPLLQPPSASEPPPSMSAIRHVKWRSARHAAIESHARDLMTTHPAKSSYVEVAYLNAEWEATGSVLFHPYESMLIAADTHAAIGVWNYSEEERGHERVNTFKNENPPGSKVNGMKFINEKSVSLLLVASDEGVVRIWRNIHEEGKQTLVTAWVANPQPEVFYGPPPAAASTNTLATGMNASAHQPLDNNVITPSHSYQDPGSGGPGSLLTPQARLLQRGSITGVGYNPLATGAAVGSVLAVGMRHSASTPVLALSAGSSSPSHPSHSSNSRSGSSISPAGSLLPAGSAAAGGAQPTGQSPTLRAGHSPNMGPSSGAMNIPSYSLSGGGNAPQQKHSPQTNGAAGMNGQNGGALTGSSSSSSSASSRRKHRPPLIVEWQPSHGRLLASGNGLEHLRLWDVHQEQCISEIPILGHESMEPHLTTWVTSMDTNDGDMAWVGCIDGHLRCFDIRLPPVESLVSTARLHRSPVHSVRLQRHGQDGGMLISASVGGDIALADIRMVDSSVVRYHRLSHKDKSSSLDAFACHDYAAICASGSPKPFIELFDHTGMTLETIRYHVGFLGVRLSPVTALAFHPHKLLLCAGFAGPSLSVFAGPEANTSARR